MKVLPIILAIVVALAACAIAGDAPPSADAERAAQLASQLAGSDQGAVDQAMDAIHTLMESSPDESVGFCRRYWLPSLISASHFDQAEELAAQAILAAPWQTGNVESLQEARVRILLRAGKASAALSQAHSLFNVASLRGTEHDLLLVAECLKAVRGEDNAMLGQFRKEQLAGATTRPVDQPGPGSPTIAGIPEDPSPYAAVISQYVSDDDQSRMAKGNLLLLAGRVGEAQAIFESLYRLSSADDRISAAENVARAMKASDGTIGRANGYMLSQAAAQSPQ